MPLISLEGAKTEWIPVILPDGLEDATLTRAILHSWMIRPKRVAREKDEFDIN